MASTRRDPSIDVIRGMCVASMVITHTALHSLLHKVTHAALWIDGATGFVLLAGLVIGMVQARAATSRMGLAKLARRTSLVYASHVGLVCLALVCAPWDRMAPQSPPPAAALGGWPSALWQAVTLRINPFNVYILSMYVVLFAVAAVGVVLLRRGHPWVLATGSLAVYLVRLWAPPGWAVLPEYSGVDSFIDLAGWQALFVSALLVGWYWRTSAVGKAFASRRLAVAAGGAVVLLCGAAQLVVRREVLAPWASVDDLTRAAFDKGTMGPGRLLLGWCAFTVLYYLLRQGRPERLQRLLVTGFGRVGRRSLDSFVLLSVAVVVLGAVAPYRPAGLVGMVCAGAVYAAIWSWARMRDSYAWARLRDFDGWARLRDADIWARSRNSQARRSVAAPNESAGASTASPASS